ncbi:MAG: AI-2E family transporter [Deltaproteobacteria bacterium]|nr:AI-2E family transporter [Deltaproteobacteria bacterium]
MGLDYPLLWGVLAFALNYVPNIGSIIAAVPAVLLAVIQIGIFKAMIIAAGYAVINLAMGSVIEPRFMGLGLGLSTSVVFLSLLFRGWILGPVGMLLSVPLTITVKIALDSREESRWIATYLFYSFVRKWPVCFFCIPGIKVADILQSEIWKFYLVGINDSGRDDMYVRPAKLLPETQTACSRADY